MCALGVVAVCNGLLAMIPFKLPKMNMMKAKRSTKTTGGLIENELRLRGRHVARKLSKGTRPQHLPQNRVLMRAKSLHRSQTN